MGLLTEGVTEVRLTSAVLKEMAFLIPIGELQVADMQKHFLPQMPVSVKAAVNLKSF